MAYLSSNHGRKFHNPQLGDETALILQAPPNIWMIAWKKSCVILHPNCLSIIKGTANSLKLEQFQLHLPNVWFAKLLTSRWKKHLWWVGSSRFIDQFLGISIPGCSPRGGKFPMNEVIKLRFPRCSPRGGKVPTWESEQGSMRSDASWTGSFSPPENWETPYVCPFWKHENQWTRIYKKRPLNRTSSFKSFWQN